MTRPTTEAVRRTAGDVSGQMAPHLNHARDVMVDTVIPKARETMVETVLPRARDAKDVMVDTVIPKAKDTMVDTVIPLAKSKAKGTASKAKDTAEIVMPKAKAAGAGLAVRAGMMEAPKKRHPIRKMAFLGMFAVGAYAAWNAWRMPQESDDWTSSEAGVGKVRTDGQEGDIPSVPADTTRTAF